MTESWRSARQLLCALDRMGENLLTSSAAGRPLMKWRENTLRSFNAAASAGASFVEFDVQVCECALQALSPAHCWHGERSIAPSSRCRSLRTASLSSGTTTTQ